MVRKINLHLDSNLIVHMATKIKIYDSLVTKMKPIHFIFVTNNIFLN